MSEFNFRRGAAEIEKAGAKGGKKGGGGGGSFAPSIFWNEDKQEKYIWILNDIESIPRIESIEFIPQRIEREDGTHFEFNSQVIARTDPAIGGTQDPLVEEYDARPKDANFMVAVELEPTLTEVRGRMRPTGFEVKTKTFERRVRDEDGNVTDEMEEVTTPVYGFITQSASNFGAAIASYDASEAPIHETPLKVQRLGKDRNTQYQVVGYPEQDIDATGLLENLDGITYLGEEGLEEVAARADLDDANSVALALGEVLLEKRLNELADQERYDAILDNLRENPDVTTLDKFGGGKKAKEKSAPTNGTPKAKKAAKPVNKQRDPDTQGALDRLRARAKEREPAEA